MASNRHLSFNPGSFGRAGKRTLEKVFAGLFAANVSSLLASKPILMDHAIRLHSITECD